MLKQLLCVTALAAALAGCNAHSEQADNRVAGDMESLHPLSCVDFDQVKTSDTAADIAAGIRSCVDQNKFDKAAPLAMIYTAYVNFDARRVADSTARSARQDQANKALEGADPEQINGLKTAAGELWNSDEKRMKVCHFLANSMPTYRPDYMISHGTDPQTPALVADFNAEKSWSHGMGLLNCQ